MNSRGTVIVALLALEVAIGAEAVVAVHRGSSAGFDVAQTRAGSSAPRSLRHEIFEPGAHPALTVDIGYADLTIETHKASSIDVSVRASSAFGLFRAKAPITAHASGDMIRIVSPGESGWSMGDDRMVTVLVPAETHVTVLDAGNITANGLRAEASMRSVGSGSITVEDYRAPALQIGAARGRIVLHGIVTARLHATSGTGRFEGTALQVRDGTIESKSRVTLGFATGTNTLVSAQTNNGRIHALGFIPTAVTTAQRSNADDDEKAASQTVRIGAGEGRFDVHSSNGSINLMQDI